MEQVMRKLNWVKVAFTLNSDHKICQLHKMYGKSLPFSAPSRFRSYMVVVVVTHFNHY